MAERMESTVQTLRRFAASEAHELKTSLTSLRTDLEMAENEKYPTRLLALIERAKVQVHTLERLTSGLLDLPHMETSETGSEMEHIDLGMLLCQISESYAARAEQSGQMFGMILPAESVILNGNPARLSLPLGNLVNNAIKLTGLVGMVILSLKHDENRIKVIVEDSGCGIPAEDLPLIFERFHRGRNASNCPGSVWAWQLYARWRKPMEVRCMRKIVRQAGQKFGLKALSKRDKKGCASFGNSFKYRKEICMDLNLTLTKQILTLYLH